MSKLITPDLRTILSRYIQHCRVLGCKTSNYKKIRQMLSYVEMFEYLDTQMLWDSLSFFYLVIEENNDEILFLAFKDRPTITACSSPKNHAKLYHKYLSTIEEMKQ